MTRMFAVGMLAVLLVACASQSPVPANSAEAASSAPAEASSEKLVCNPAPTGSRLPNKKVCMTKEEWAAIRAQSQEATRNMQQGVVTQRQ